MRKDEREVFSKIMREIGGKGGKKRAAALTPARRSEIAKKAAAARWGSKSASKK